VAIDCTPYAEHRKLLETPDADHLAELYLLQADLAAAYETLSLHRQKYLCTGELDDEGKIISNSLLRDAILLFCSCFSTKDPNKLDPKAVFGHLEDWESLYGVMLDTRDSFVAHNFGPSRQHKIVAICLEIDGRLVPAGMTQYHVRFAGWTAEETDKLLAFIDVARGHINALVEVAEKPILKLLETISSEELAALKDGEFKVPERKDIRSSRARFRESGRGQRFSFPSRRLVRTIDEGPDAPRLTARREDADEKAAPK
jgi:hypothetical protein